MLSGGLEGWSGCSFKALLIFQETPDDDDDGGDGAEEYHRCFPGDLRGGRVVFSRPWDLLVNP